MFELFDSSWAEFEAIDCALSVGTALTIDRALQLRLGHGQKHDQGPVGAQVGGAQVKRHDPIAPLP
jgi:hypothetical protein